MGAEEAGAQATANVGVGGGNTWNPNNPTVQVGGTVNFTNPASNHSLSIGGTPVRASGMPWTYAYTAPATPGTVSFLCTIHPGMIGTINVVAAPATPIPVPGTPTPGTPTPATPGTPAVDSVAPKVTKVAATGTLRRAVVKLKLDEAATVTARLTRQGQTTTLKKITRSLKAGERELTLTRSLTAGKKYRVSLRIVDAAGNVSTKTISFTAKRPS
jgi:plastocyanin